MQTRLEQTNKNASTINRETQEQDKQDNLSPPSNSPPTSPDIPKQNGRDGSHDTKKDPADVLRGVAGSASQVVFQAAAILEEEIAAGIVAAKQIEEHLTHSKVLPVGNGNTLTQRLRRDLHEVVDIILNFVDAMADYVPMPDEAGVSIRGLTQPEHPSRTQQYHLPSVVTPQAVKSGEVVTLAMKVTNRLAEPTSELTFVSTDLVSAGGDRLYADQIEFAPAIVSLEPNAVQDVSVVVRIPHQMPAGTYSGLIQTIGSELFRALLIVQVDQDQ